ncbi:hypothetical protein GIB67_012808 [Kingdonia uniflora]|uniref:poly(A)-specific ribonuclease n=1 Tax=Kingdonia uniflora TaxID=39325 RepID=A0A7J7NFA8_9MAGN|nr:hypothetical protein GIB67_012808 [Kingdonia uniflora]
MAIKEVWSHNFGEAILEIEMITKKYPYCAFDTEFPGFLRSSPRDAFQDVRYEDLKFNVDRLKLIQIGFSFSDENGNTPPVSTYQFNFNDFDLRKDAYVSVSIDLLTRNGIDMAKNLREGVDPGIFSGWFTQILIRNPNMKWITFHGLYDLGYLMKTLMRNTPLPSSLGDFLKGVRVTLRNICPSFAMGCSMESLD